MKIGREFGLLDVALEIVGCHSNGLGEGVIITIDESLLPTSSWLRTYSSSPLLDVVSLVEPDAKELSNLKRNSFTEWMFTGIDRSVCVRLLGSSRVLERIEDLDDTDLIGNAVLKWDARVKFYRSPFAVHTTVNTLEIEVPEKSLFCEYDRAAIQTFMEAKRCSRGNDSRYQEFGSTSGFVPTGLGQCSLKIKKNVAAGPQPAATT